MNEKQCSQMAPVTEQLIHQFLELEGNLIRLKMAYKASLAVRGGEGGRRGYEFNPRTGQGRILAILKLQPEIEQKELGYLLDMSRQALAELLAKLEKSGYITREQSEKDRRSYVVKLTDQGRDVAEQVAGAEVDNDDDPLGLAAALGTLAPDEQAKLSEYLERISAAIRDRLGGEAGDPREDFAEFFREKFFNKHGFDRRDFARFGFDPRGHFDGRGPRGGFDGADPHAGLAGREGRGGHGGRDPRVDRRTRAFR